MPEPQARQNTSGVENGSMFTTRTALALGVALARVHRLAATEPEPGDLVVEVSWFSKADPDAIGWLVGHDDAPYGKDDPLDGTVPMREVWDIIPLSGAKGVDGSDVQRWENARFVKVPDRVLRQVPEVAACRPLLRGTGSIG